MSREHPHDEALRREYERGRAEVLRTLTDEVWSRKKAHARLMAEDGDPRTREWGEDTWFLDLLKRVEQG